MAFSFWLVTAVLLIFYGWTLTETVPIVVKVQDGLCTAVLGERSSKIPCSGIDGGDIGLYLTSTSLVQKLWYRPLDLLTPGTAWDEMSIGVADGTSHLLIPGDGHELDTGTAVSWPAPEMPSYTIQARAKRPDGENAGILLFEPGSNDGLLFQVDSENRQAVWRRWQDGQPGETIAGVPYQKPYWPRGSRCCARS